jgi:hypothetical protein
MPAIADQLNNSKGKKASEAGFIVAIVTIASLVVILFVRLLVKDREITMRREARQKDGQKRLLMEKEIQSLRSQLRVEELRTPAESSVETDNSEEVGKVNSGGVDSEGLKGDEMAMAFLDGKWTYVRNDAIPRLSAEQVDDPIGYAMNFDSRTSKLST